MPERIKDKGHGCLYVVATPIGNLKDITLRAIEVLGQVDLIAAEDTRRTRRLLNAHDLHNQLISYHEHNETQRTSELMAKLEQGMSIALVTDAGTPAVSDPGYRLVAEAVTRRFEVVPIPGVSAAVTALSVSGLPTDQFTFIGFPPRKKKKRLAQLEALRLMPHTLIFYQSPKRLILFLNELLAVMGDRNAVLAREQTKRHEEFLRAPLSKLIEQLAARDTIKGECTLLVSGSSSTIPVEGDVESAIELALSTQDRPTGEIAGMLARQFGLSRKEIYDRILKLRKSS